MRPAPGWAERRRTVITGFSQAMQKRSRHDIPNLDGRDRRSIASGSCRLRVAAIEIRPQGQVPVPFALSYDPQRIEDRHSYALQARISSHDGLLFITTTMNPISTGGADNADLVLERVGGRSGGRRPPAEGRTTAHPERDGRAAA
ncbi:YbaY family lipoprotein [Paracoccus aminovorans]|nr:YbaY family lipoprotein [Paracoccus aminovorans]